ncbi:MAG: glycosyl hydrolase family 18 [Gemmatimonadetes bacterium]|jgi:chitinase|nr:glycosyl hydrolase family 18 [Gemmatimonadota bacterium]MBT6147692.1 glycosyl hydrolase family 18 [Gemmatimonadota bacterium]MBT7863718.1 glycosyl hydrolase family 18 [Gemmatimonadota bacterium]
MRSHRLWLVPVSALRLGCLLMALTCGCASMPGTRVVGYMPAWKGLRQTVENTDLEPLTHINIAFLNPDTSGAFVEGREPLCMRGATAQELDHLVERAHAADVRVLVSLGGGLIPECSGDWEALLVPERRSEMVEALVHFAETFELDGIDVDLEGRLLTAIDEAGNYTPFVEQLSAALQPSGKLVTCATASYTGGMIPVESIPFFDFVNIMSYDAIGPSWGQAGTEHSTYEMSQRHVEIWQQRGLPPDKMVLGVPFYGYGFGEGYESSYTFGDILKTFGSDAAGQDLIGEACDGCSYVTYNGVATIRRKTRLALEKGSGVMIWEMSQDAPGDDNLLKVIQTEIER